MKIEATVTRGGFAGATVTPHRGRQGYLVSRTKYERDQRYVNTLDEVAKAIRAGFSIRMSGPKGYSSSLFVPDSISIWSR